MNKYQKALLDSIDTKLQEFGKRLKFDYTVTAKVLSLNESTNTYTVLYNGSELQIKAREGLTLEPNDLVYIRVIQGNFSNKFIDCKKP
ncbi:hypothetical protein [Tissierella pigra]|uniref:Uncharacterized protein n=1 Tax=Tissierella pigra TaxID=2607614 RepID=A0A6N7Y0B8_9FIRM|nr:hypothetical protein [Tissierella pigra]MSU01928.1 hypothetical protein [Tissierella pigra]